MSLLDTLQNVLGQGFTPNSGQGGAGPIRGDSGSGGTSLQGVLGQLFGDPKSGAGVPILGGLIGAFAGRNAFSGAAGGALLMKGIQMYAQYKDRMKEAAAQNPASPAARNYIDVTAAPSSPDEQVKRIIRALVYAAKSDGHVDDTEREAIKNRIQGLNLGAEGERLIQEAMNESVDPKRIADGVKTPEEALDIFTVSCAVLHSGGFMVNAYLGELAKDLAIPDDVRDDLIGRISNAGNA